jgi:hypothetical protein
LDESQTFQDEPTSSKFEMRSDGLGMIEVDSALAPQMPVIELRGLSESKEVIVGRNEENDIVIHDETVSANHAMFVIETPGQVQLRDLGSKNGTEINQNMLAPGGAVVLQDGDELSFGNVCYIFFSPGGLYDVLKVAFPNMQSGVRPLR